MNESRQDDITVVKNVVTGITVGFMMGSLIWLGIAYALTH